MGPNLASRDGQKMPCILSFVILKVLYLTLLPIYYPVNLQVSPKMGFWHTVRTQMKCHIKQHFIRVFMVCKGKINLQRKNFFLKIITCDELFPSEIVFIIRWRHCANHAFSVIIYGPLKMHNLLCCFFCPILFVSFKGLF